jgi:adenylosuccinate synthase
MPAIVVVGAQWGDEGKGKIVDLASEHAEVVVRYAGGPNAGHTLVVGDDKVVVRLVPSGILHPHTHCVMGQGMVIDPRVLLAEIDLLERKGLEVGRRLLVSELAHLVMPYHLAVDGLRESGASGDRKIGTTKKGIGPAYEDKTGRRGLRIADLRDRDRVREIIGLAAKAWAPTLAALGGEPIDARAVEDEILGHGPRLLSMAGDGSLAVDEAYRAGKRILLEGAQGTLLDVDHGTYPFVTSSSAVAGGACTGAGIGPSRIGRTIGITKAYATRVGEGPFPSELFDELGQRLRDRGGEYGSVTGRPRRCGWLDLPALRYAARVNGIDAWAITKLDVLGGLDEVGVCVAYETSAGRTRELPVAELASAKPIIETLPGWKEDIDAARSIAELPLRAAELVRFVEAETGVPADVVSVGPRRDQTIVVRDLFAIARTS